MSTPEAALRRLPLWRIEDALEQRGFALEYTQEMARSGLRPQRGGVLVPPEMFRPEAALETGGSDAGEQFVFKVMGAYGGARASIARVLQAGATLITDVRNPIEFPRFREPPTPVWMGENPGSDVAEADALTDTETPAPKQALGWIPETRRWRASRTPQLAGVTERALREQVNTIIDTAVIAGDDVLQPWGLLDRADNGNVRRIGLAGAAATHADLVNAELNVGRDNHDVGPLALITSPRGRAKLRTTEKSSGSGQHLWSDDNRVLGHRAFASNSVPSNLPSGGNFTAAILGHWPDVLIFLHAVELVVDPFSMKKQGLVEVSVWVLVSVGLLWPSFCVIDDMAQADLP